jgi:hypothetical protein
LGNQRLEASIIIATVEGRSFGWRNHPAVRMWKEYPCALKLYYNLCIDEWVKRGYKNNMKKHVVDNVVYPFWIGNDAFHASHRSNLLRKNKEWYSKYFIGEPDDLPYVWPV